MISNATKRSMLRWIHTIFSIPILGRNLTGPARYSTVSVNTWYDVISPAQMPATMNSNVPSRVGFPVSNAVSLPSFTNTKPGGELPIRLKLTAGEPEALSYPCRWTAACGDRDRVRSPAAGHWNATDEDLAAGVRAWTPCGNPVTVTAVVAG
jgi:hypothetical protein